jgi:hypothetical protein
MEKEMEKAKNLVKYCDSVYKTQRRKTRTVHCGDVPIGTTSITTYIDTCTYLTKTFTPCNLPIGTTYGLHTLPHILFLFFGTTYGLHTLPHTYFTTYFATYILPIQLSWYCSSDTYYIHIHTLLLHTHTYFTTYGLHTLPHTYFATYFTTYILCHIHTLLHTHTYFTTYGLHTLPHTYFTTYLLYLCTSSPSMKTPQFLLLLLGITPSAKHHSMK